jgi:GAF domain-containing protein
MTSPRDDLMAAASVAVLPSDREQRLLLQSVVEVARAIFDARASSIFLLDPSSGSLVFEAVAGAGSDHLVGQGFPADEGIAGWVLTARHPMVVDDLRSDTRFARDLAESTGHVPTTMLAAPLLFEDEALGVMEVLDRTPDPRRILSDLELLGLFASQAAVALRIVQRARSAQQVLDGGDAADVRAVVGITTALTGRVGPHREAGQRLLEAIHALLSEEAGAPV